MCPNKYEGCEFQIDEIFHVGDSSGPVVGGLLAKGQLFEGDELIIGPLDSGEFVSISVCTIYRNRVRCGAARAGHSASLGLRPAPVPLRPGMVLLAPPRSPRARPVWGACGGRCTKEPVTTSQTDKNKKNARRQTKNILQDIANVQNSLTKPVDMKNPNFYTEHQLVSKTEKNEERIEFDKCMCNDLVLLEDPNDPRGCIYFQATVRVLRHSTIISPGFQCSVHVANVRQTAIIEGIMAPQSALRAGEAASVLFRFVRCPEYLVRGRRLLLTAGLGTRAIGRVTQTFPYVP